MFLVVVALLCVHAGLAYTVEGDTVYVDTGAAYVGASPHTIVGSGWVENEVVSKQASLNAIAALCFNGEYLSVSDPQYWSPRNDSFVAGNGSLVEQYSTWQDYAGEYTHIRASDVGQEYLYGDRTDCYAIQNVPLAEGVSLRTRFWMDAPVVPYGMSAEEAYPGFNGKYDIAWWPQSYGFSRSGILSAIAGGDFFLLDPTVNLTSGLVVYTTYDDADTSGSVAVDFQGNLNGTLVNSPTTGQAVILGEAYRFDYGADSHVLYDNLANSLSDFTVSLWLSDVDDIGSDQFVLSIGDTSNNRGTIRVDTSGHLVQNFEFDTNAATVAGSANVFNGLSHVVIVWDDSTGRVEVFVNGTIDINSTLTTGQVGDASDPDITIGLVEGANVITVGSSCAGRRVVSKSGCGGQENQ